METIKTNKGEFIFILLPDHPINAFVNMGYLLFKISNPRSWVSDKTLGNPWKLEKWIEKNKDTPEWLDQAVKLPEGEWKFISLIGSLVLNQNITENLAVQIVDDNGMGCYDNYRLKKDEKYTCATALDSLKCLMEAANIDSQKSYAVLVKQK